ncbi:Commelina yellow mottle virus, Orf1 [Dillenia turbinata]|uniref:Commelina yellow mottle virus, Orf1 n=1 Tax=Dillenia turbinata TaxID=194707 RepID=A0AAN8Z6H3_9MAGN
MSEKWEQAIQEWYEKSHTANLEYLDLASKSSVTNQHLAHNISVIFDRISLSSRVNIKSQKQILERIQDLEKENRKLRLEVANLTKVVTENQPLTKSQVLEITTQISKQPKEIEERALKLTEDLSQKLARVETLINREPAEGFVNPGNLRGTASTQVANTKQLNTVIYLLINLQQRFESLEEKVEKLQGKLSEQKPAPSLSPDLVKRLESLTEVIRAPTARTETVTPQFEDQIRDYRRNQRRMHNAGRTMRQLSRRIHGRPVRQETLETAINPERELNLSLQRRASIVPAEGHDPRRKLQQTPTSRIEIHPYRNGSRRGDGGYQMIYVIPDIIMTIPGLGGNVQISIQTRGYHNWQGGEANLLVTRGLVGRLSNTSNVGFQYSINAVTDYLVSRGVRAIPGRRFTEEELRGNNWIIRPSRASIPMEPTTVTARNLPDGSVSLRFGGYQAATSASRPRYDANDNELQEDSDSESIRTETVAVMDGEIVLWDPEDCKVFNFETQHHHKVPSKFKNSNWDVLERGSKFMVRYDGPVIDTRPVEPDNWGGFFEPDCQNEEEEDDFCGLLILRLVNNYKSRRMSEKWEQAIQEWYEKSHTANLEYLDLASKSSVTNQHLAHNISVIFDRISLSSRVNIKSQKQILERIQDLEKENRKLRLEVANLTKVVTENQPLTKSQVLEITTQISKQPKEIEERARS